MDKNNQSLEEEGNEAKPAEMQIGGETQVINAVSPNENYLNTVLFWMGILLAICGGIFSILLFRSKRIIKK